MWCQILILSAFATTLVATPGTNNTLASMSEELNSLPAEGEQVPTSSQVTHHRRRRRSHSSQGSDFRGRLWLILIFLALRGIEVVTYLLVPEENNSRLIGSIINNAIWSAALLTGIWYRQNWCRYILIGLLLVTVVTLMIVLPDALVLLGDDLIVVLLAGITLAYVAIVWVLISSPDIRRLTDRTDDWKRTLPRM